MSQTWSNMSALTKTLIAIFLIFLIVPLIIAIPNLGSRVGNLNTQNNTNSSNENRTNVNANIDVIKERMTANLDKKINSLENLKKKCTNSSIDEKDKELINSNIDKVIIGLENYKINISNASTIEEIVIIKKETNQYIKDNKDEIKKAVKDISLALSDEIIKKLNEIVVRIEQAVNNLTEQCPEATTELEKIKNDLHHVEKKLAEMEILADKGNYNAVFVQMGTLNTEITDIINQLEPVWDKCGEEIAQNAKEQLNQTKTQIKNNLSITKVIKVNISCNYSAYLIGNVKLVKEYKNYTYIATVYSGNIQNDNCITVSNLSQSIEIFKTLRKQAIEQRDEKFRQILMNRTITSRDVIRDKLKEYLQEINKDYQDFVTPSNSVVTGYLTQNNLNSQEKIFSNSLDWIWISDTVLNNAEEKWLLPEEFINDTPTYPTNPAPGKIASDCEEHANTLVSLLIASEGYNEENARVSLGLVNFSGSIGGHAWAEIYDGMEWMPLEPSAGSYYDEQLKKVIYIDESNKIPFDYFKYTEYPVVEVWYQYNDKYFADKSNPLSSNAPSFW